MLSSKYVHEVDNLCGILLYIKLPKSCILEYEVIIIDMTQH